MIKSKKTILYVGNLTHENTTVQRMRALKDLGYDLDLISTGKPCQRSSLRVLRFTGRQYYQKFCRNKVNQQILATLEDQSYPMLWVDKGLDVSPDVLHYCRSNDICSVSYSPDDMMNPANQSAYYLEDIPLYDYHVTTKTYNVAELKALGAREVLFVGNAYAPEIHHPPPDYPNSSFAQTVDVGFIGAYEADRNQQMMYLVEKGIQVEFCCPALPRNISPKEVVACKQGFLAGAHYREQIWRTKINLCYLRKVNRDVQTTRSMEIPACGGFMLGERTDEHLELFEEGKEAEFFSSQGEMVEKVTYYLQHDEQRTKIANAGYQRCVDAGYSNQGRLGKVLEMIKSSCL
jgi:spore maturation protein CgeB